MARFKIKRRSSRRTPPPVEFIPDSNLFPMPPPPTEDATNVIQSLLGGEIWDSKEELEAKMAELMKSGEINRRISSPAADPVERARQLGAEALRAKTVGESQDLAAQALALDPECVDALLAQIPFAEQESIPRYQEAVAIARRLAGDEAPGEYRPYIRALQHLAVTCFWIDEFDTAAAALEEILERDQRDRLGARDMLLTIYLRRRDREGARRLQARFPLSESAAWNWGLVLVESLWGAEAARAEALTDAGRVNPDTLSRLFGMDGKPDPHTRCWPGSPEEADNAALLLWRAVGDDPTEALGWLAGQVKAQAGKEHVHGPNCNHDHHH